MSISSGVLLIPVERAGANAREEEELDKEPRPAARCAGRGALQLVFRRFGVSEDRGGGCDGDDASVCDFISFCFYLIFTCLVLSLSLLPLFETNLKLACFF